MSLREDAEKIISSAIAAAKPDAAVASAVKLAGFPSGKLVLIAIGKAAWQMARTACLELPGRISHGVVSTKYGHSEGELPGIQIFEAGHPVPDENSVLATKAAMEAVKNLSSDDAVLFLISGGGSSLFECPLVPLEELKSLTQQLLSKGADIVEINTIRKRISAVKGGRFAKLCEPAQVFSIVLSDIIGDPLDMIASGPAYPDSSTSSQALAIAKKYKLKANDETMSLFRKETPKKLENVTAAITGSVSQLCNAASLKCVELGYDPFILTASLTCSARDAGSFLSAIARHHAKSAKSLAFIAGGETVVEIKGKGLGGRNQELALSAAAGISGLDGVCIFSVGSDGTDGPTDAAGGFVDGGAMERLKEKGIDLFSYLADNNSYEALGAIDGLIKTGPTGTNVNDLSVVLVNRR
ncbi:MAG: glycerate kinase [Clostridiales bacterium]|jgi:hydroxypyruvate reductase|nr:glycerate kinase [Clostridiales bacterium]